MQKEDVPRENASKLVEQEIEQYIKRLERNCTQYKIVEQIAQNDGSVIVKVIKQYNACNVGDYLN